LKKKIKEWTWTVTLEQWKLKHEKSWNFFNGNTWNDRWQIQIEMKKIQKIKMKN
jgi:hypothetical protein